MELDGPLHGWHKRLKCFAAGAMSRLKSMEPVTHFLTGACLGRAGLNRKTAYATLAATLAAEAPDIDVVAGFGGPVAGFAHHRGITHTLVGAPVMALLVTGLVYGVHRLRRKKPRMPVRWAWVWLVALIADFSHLLLDLTNNYGLRPFYPFQPRWYSLDLVFIVEPLLLLALGLALVLPAIFALVEQEQTRTRTLFRGRGLAIAALSFMVLLWALRNAEHAHAIAPGAGRHAGDWATGTRGVALRRRAIPGRPLPLACDCGDPGRLPGGRGAHSFRSTGCGRGSARQSAGDPGSGRGQAVTAGTGVPGLVKLAADRRSRRGAGAGQRRASGRSRDGGQCGLPTCVFPTHGWA